MIFCKKIKHLYNLSTEWISLFRFSDAERRQVAALAF